MNKHIDCVFLETSNNNCMKWLTLDMVYQKYPIIKTKFNWAKEDFEAFVDGKLLIGKFGKIGDEKKEQLLIDKDTLEKLIIYRKNSEQI